jgi:hypothetical protein
MIAHTQTPEVWRTDDNGKITHVPSGLTCTVMASDDRVQLYGLASNSGWGGSDSCAFKLTLSTGIFGIILRVFPNGGQTSEALLAESVRETQRDHQDWKPAGRPQLATFSVDDNAGRKIAPSSASFTFAQKTLQMRHSIWISPIGKWAIEASTTYPEVDTRFAEEASVTLWADAFGNIAEAAK